MNVLAIDIGGTFVKVGLVSDTAKVSQKSKFPTLMNDLTTFETRLLTHLKQYDLSNISGIAFSCTGIARQAELSMGEGNPIYQAFGTTLPSKLQTHYQIPVTVENDGNCAILAEHWCGAAQNMPNVASIVIGTSIGGAVIINHQLYRGSHHLAGEFGYALFEESPQQFNIWSIVGSTGRMLKDLPQLESGYELMAQYQQNNAEVVAVFDAFIEKIAIQCYNLQYFLDPNVILLGGGISENPLVIDKVQAKIIEIAQQIPSNVIIPKVVACQYGNDANLLGAARFWLENLPCTI